MTLVRRATPEDRAAVVATVMDAFREDPAWAFMTGGDYDRISPLFAGALFDSRVDAGGVWLADDTAAVSLWDRHDEHASPPDHSTALWDEYRDAVGETSWALLKAYEDALAVARPRGAYWYLGVLATRPDRRRQGLADAVVAPVLSVADRDGLDCWLETSTLANRGYYERRGFAVAADVEVPGGPTTWWMRRPPRADRGVRPPG
jgi:GNAT superfamily N-acetyltransferase